MSLNAPKLPDLTRKGDIATFGLGYGGGFALGILIFGSNGSPLPLTVALVVAIVCVAIKYAYEATQEPTSEESLMAEQRRRQDRLRARFNGLEQVLDYSVIFTGFGGEVIKTVLGDSSEVLFEHHWEPNPNYGPQPVDYTEEQPYIRHERRGDASQRLAILRSLWEAGAATDEYVEARLNELSDLTYQQVYLQYAHSLKPEELKEQGFVQPAPEEPGSPS